MRRALIGLFAVACVPLVAQKALPLPAGSQSPTTATQPTNDTGLVTGQVTDSRGTGVPDAIVMLQGGYRPIALTTDNREIPGGPRFTITNSEGRFAFFNLTPGSYAFDANKPGYVGGAYGRLRPGGQPQSIELKDGERLTSIRITMWEFSSVTGTVRDETGEAVVGVQVRALRRVSTSGRWLWTSAATGTTNDRGQYRVDGLLPGNYLFVAASTQTSIPFPSEIASTPNALPEVQMQLMRIGVSPGAGRPIGNWLWNSGSRSAMAVPDPTDDGRILIYPTTFYPKARSTREADMVLVESGQQRSGVDLQLQLVPATTVSGIVVGPEGPIAGQTVRLAPDYIEDLSGDLRGLEAAVTVSDTKGAFFFAGVPAGQYVLQAEVVAPPTSGPSVTSGTAAAFRGGWANDRLRVAEDGIAGMTLTLRPTVRVTGQIAFDGTKPPPAADLISRFSVSLETIGFALNRAEAPYIVNFDRNGQFTFSGVPPGTYEMTFRAAVADRRAMPDWETKGVTLNGRDISDHPFTITDDVNNVTVTLTDHNSELNGTVRDATGKVDSTAAVLMFTAERDLWMVRSTKRIRILRASETGAYSVRGVPPGQYFLIAIPDTDVADYPDPDMLESLSKLATSFAMTSGERKTLDLILKSIK